MSTMSLTARITIGGPSEEPEDFFASSLGVIFPDDVTNQHGDTGHPLIYTSPHMPRPLLFDLSDPSVEKERRLFSHYLWNSSLLLAELVERDTLPVKGSTEENNNNNNNNNNNKGNSHAVDFSVRGLRMAEVGAGTALPSIMGALLGAEKILVTDYPTDTVLKVLRANVQRNTAVEMAPSGKEVTGDVSVQGHQWGHVDGEDMAPHRHAYDRVLACDCLWMPGEHDSLRRSLGFLLAESADARVWVVAGFHTGRAKVAGFFEKEALRGEGLEIETIWECDCNGLEREWREDAPEEDPTVRKRWLVVGILKRVME